MIASLRHCVIAATLARDVSLLCPPKPSTTDKVGGLYHKSQFAYDADQDVYLCPAGQRLQWVIPRKIPVLHAVNP